MGMCFYRVSAPTLNLGSHARSSFVARGCCLSLAPVRAIWSRHPESHTRCVQAINASEVVGDCASLAVEGYTKGCVGGAALSLVQPTTFSFEQFAPLIEKRGLDAPSLRQFPICFLFAFCGWPVDQDMIR